jgi:hypothetical protein
VPVIIPKDNVRRKRLDGVSEAREALPDFRQARKNVDVIVHSADFDGMALKVLQYTCHVRVGLTPNFLRTQERPPIFRREDSMHNQVGKGLGHRI